MIFIEKLRQSSKKIFALTSYFYFVWAMTFEEQKSQILKEIKDWLRNYYTEYKNQALSENELNEAVAEWCKIITLVSY